jgi:hypothetical protein
MLDPLIDGFKGLIASLVTLAKGVWLAILWPFRSAHQFMMRRKLWIRITLGLIVFPIIVSYVLFFWNAAWIRGYDTSYPDSFVSATPTVAAGDQVTVEGAGDTTLTCGRSRTVDAVTYLIDFNVNTNNWMSSNPLYKLGFFGIDWDRTWILDNKAAFQRGIHQAIGRTSIEMSDRLGRVRGTSQIDPNLKSARGSLQFNQYTWFINPFGDQPFGPTTRSQTYYRQGIESLEAYQTDLVACDATFDARADNLMQFIDRIANDIGSTSASLKTRAEGYNAGWFDTRADDIFWNAKGQLYAYYGILKGARADFDGIITSRGLGALWDEMEDQTLSAINLDPFIVSNGKEDGWLMPTHLTTIGFYILRVRSNLVELRSILER